MDEDKKKTVVQCKSCPWRVDCVPDRDIPNYSRDMHVSLDKTIQTGLSSLPVWSRGVRHVMACHYSKPGEEIACAGWLHNQLGVGNNLGLRLAVMTGKMPVPEVDGDQHEDFEDTIPPCEVPKRGGSKRSMKKGRD